MAVSDLRRVFFQAIAESPDDDTPRLVYADWLDDHGDGADRDRAEFIRLQCDLAKRPADDPARHALVAREKELLDAHRTAWTDLAFADWLGHRKRACGNPHGHDFCKLVARGVRVRCERDTLPEGDRRRKKLDRLLQALGRRMQEEFSYQPGTCEAALFDSAEFRRGFVEGVCVQDYAVVAFAEALADVAVVRDLQIENDSVADLGDEIVERLVPILSRLRLRKLDSAESIPSLDSVRTLAASPGLRHLEELAVWFDGEDNGDEAVEILLASHLTALRSLTLEHSRTFTDRAFLAILNAPALAGLRHCKLIWNENLEISPEVEQRFEARFGPLR
jgi:uncharacterized protein (TIGR02996 family)